MLKIIDHPLIKIKLTKMRDYKTKHTTFKKNLNEIASLMVYEIFRDYKGKRKIVKTPTETKMIGLDFDKDVVVVPILRAGLGMVEGIQNMLPQAKVGHIGMYRDEKTFKAVEYFYKIPSVAKNSSILVVDPMLATGVSAIDAITRLKEDGFQNINLVCLVGAPEGVKAVLNKFKDIDIFLASLDEKLNSKKYIIPGLGDAGDRIFGTK